MKNYLSHPEREIIYLPAHHKSLTSKGRGSGGIAHISTHFINLIYKNRPKQILITKCLYIVWFSCYISPERCTEYNTGMDLLY